METLSPNTIGDIPALRAHVAPGKVAYSFLGQDIDLGTFYRRTKQVANGLIKDGVSVGARICYLGKNSEIYFEVLFGTAKAGAVLAPINWRLAPPEVAYILKDCQAERLFIEKALARHGGDVRATATQLGLSRSALYRRLQHHGLRDRP